MHMLLNKFSETIILSVRIITKPFENIMHIYKRVPNALESII
jgi:hypothetical protein